MGLSVMLILAIASAYSYKVKKDKSTSHFIFLNDHKYFFFCQLLVWCKKELHNQGLKHVNTYDAIGREALGTFGVVLANIGIISNQLGVAAAFIVFVAENLTGMIKVLNLRECVAISLPILIVLSLLRDMKFLGKTSLVGLSALFVAIAVIFWTGLTNHPPIHPINILPENVFLFFGIAG